MTNGIMRFRRIIELQELAERAFLYKLKKKNPDLTQDQINLMEAGKTYVNVHTAKNPNGEIRGQIVAVG